MDPSLQKYIASARAKGHNDDRINKDLSAAGWDTTAVSAALGGGDNLEVPPPPPGKSSGASMLGTDTAVKVVAMKTTAGIEYLIMFLSLWVASMSLGAVLHSAVDKAYGQESFYTGAISFSTAALVVSLPILVWLFLYLKRKELAHPEIRRDQNRKAAIQLTLVVTFLIGIGKLIMYVYQLLNADSNNGSVLGNFFHTIITLAIAGGIFAYYWHDEHRS